MLQDDLKISSVFFEIRTNKIYGIVLRFVIQIRCDFIFFGISQLHPVYFKSNAAKMRLVSILLNNCLVLPNRIN